MTTAVSTSIAPDSVVWMAVGSLPPISVAVVVSSVALVASVEISMALPEVLSAVAVAAVLVVVVRRRGDVSVIDISLSAPPVWPSVGIVAVAVSTSIVAWTISTVVESPSMSTAVVRALSPVATPVVIAVRIRF